MSEWDGLRRVSDGERAGIREGLGAAGLEVGDMVGRLGRNVFDGSIYGPYIINGAGPHLDTLRRCSPCRDRAGSQCR